MSTIKVKLARDWFAPQVSVKVAKGDANIRSGGRLYRGPRGPQKGIHSIPEVLRDSLPSSAVILSDEEAAKAKAEAEKPVEGDMQSFKDLDPARAGAAVTAEKLAEAEAPAEDPEAAEKADEDEDFDPELAAKAEEYRQQVEAEKKERQRDHVAKARSARGKK